MGKSRRSTEAKDATERDNRIGPRAGPERCVALDAWLDRRGGGKLGADDPQIVARGATLYAEHCASCHGANLEGQPDWRVRRDDGRVPAPPHDRTGHTWHHDSDTLFRVTKFGVAALIGAPDYETDMPIYDGVPSDAEIRAIFGYIKSTWPVNIRARHDALDASR
ncbi:c-type cytochrome [Aquicoccus sp. G2-2]|uniref:c-type cytochrome n=1 Tax=Aquicoccus sp. G2-2 TaxID=3092120 RepID=UPI002AE046F7|nr:cytochrome c [Aquicoccus sp. G2-2]MEA1113909.1 cytochrome c [Aquicoccus sp. G2-2]